MAASTIYKLLSRAEWEAARAEGLYRGSAHDMRDGFIHFSTAVQLAETARKYFTRVSDLVLLAVDVDALNEALTPHPVPLPRKLALASLQRKVPAFASECGWGEGTLLQALSPVQASLLPLGEGQDEGGALRWEPARGGDLFPHLYGPLPISAVKSATAIPLGEDGIPITPCDLKP